MEYYVYEIGIAPGPQLRAAFRELGDASTYAQRHRETLTEKPDALVIVTRGELVHAFTVRAFIGVTARA